MHGNYAASRAVTAVMDKLAKEKKTTISAIAVAYVMSKVLSNFRKLEFFAFSYRFQTRFLMCSLFLEGGR